MKKKLCILLVLTLLFVSCKKQAAKPESAPPAPQNTETNEPSKNAPVPDMPPEVLTLLNSLGDFQTVTYAVTATARKTGDAQESLTTQAFTKPDPFAIYVDTRNQIDELVNASTAVYSEESGVYAVNYDGEYRVQPLASQDDIVKMMTLIMQEANPMDYHYLTKTSDGYTYDVSTISEYLKNLGVETSVGEVPAAVQITENSVQIQLDLTEYLSGYDQFFVTQFAGGIDGDAPQLSIPEAVKAKLG
ncbi:hypothetical protein AGMMS49975_01050 [Clostridia bacterium]|nr:hypothetical protein AGMMS49975_01050 [Clostridia bacterium]